jgi:hypothetical protein
LVTVVSVFAGAGTLEAWVLAAGAFLAVVTWSRSSQEFLRMVHRQGRGASS